MNITTQKANKPYFIITIDTEGDNLWSKPNKATTQNAKYLYRFQELCEEFKQKPTYLTNYEMANCRTFRSFGKEVVARNTGEIGMHLHAWDTPPLVPLTTNDTQYHPYLIEYSDQIMERKVHYLTSLLEETFGIKMVSHRAGRWGFDERYAKMLIKEGYLVDCSVTPLLSWANKFGNPAGNGGTNYVKFPNKAYWVDLSNISHPGNTPLLEVPVTTISGSNMFADRLIEIFDASSPSTQVTLKPIRKVIKKLFPDAYILRPNGKNRRQMLRTIMRVIKEDRSYAEFMLHSSEFMPGGSPTFQTEHDINNLFADMRSLFEMISKTFIGATLEEFHSRHVREVGRDSARGNETGVDL